MDGRSGLHSGCKAAHALSKLILIGKHPVAAEDVAPGKGSRCLLYEPCLYLGLVSAQSGEPGVGQCICGLKDPVRTGDTVAPAQVLHGGSAKSRPSMEVGSYLRWLLDRFCNQLCSPVGGIPKPVVKKITQGVPGPLSLDDELVGCAHSLQFGPRHRITILAIAFPVSALNYSILKIAHRAWLATYILVASPAPHSDQQVPVLVLAFE